MQKGEEGQLLTLKIKCELAVSGTSFNPSTGEAEAVNYQGKMTIWTTQNLQVLNSVRDDASINKGERV